MQESPPGDNANSREQRAAPPENNSGQSALDGRLDGRDEVSRVAADASQSNNAETPVENFLESVGLEVEPSQLQPGDPVILPEDARALTDKEYKGSHNEWRFGTIEGDNAKVCKVGEVAEKESRKKDADNKQGWKQEVLGEEKNIEIIETKTVPKESLAVLRADMPDGQAPQSEGRDKKADDVPEPILQSGNGVPGGLNKDATMEIDNSSVNMPEGPNTTPQPDHGDSNPLNGNSPGDVETAMKSGNQETESGEDHPTPSDEVRKKYNDKIKKIQDIIENEPAENSLSAGFREELERTRSLIEKYFFTKQDLDLAQKSGNTESVQSYREELESGLADRFKDVLRQLFFREAQRKEDYDALLQITPEDMSVRRDQIKLERQRLEYLPEASSQAEDMYQSAKRKLIEDENGDRWHMGFIDKDKARVKLYTADGAEQDTQWTPLVDDEMRTFGERFHIVDEVEEGEGHGQEQKEAIGEIQDLKNKAYKNLIQDDDGQYWNVGWIEEDEELLVTLFPAGGEEKVRVPFVDSDGSGFTERYSAVTDPDEADAVLGESQNEDQEQGKSERDESSVEPTSGESGDADTEKDEKGEEKMSQKSLRDIYKNVDDENKELLKEAIKDLDASEYEGINNVKEMFVNDPAFALESILGLEGGQARTEDSFPKYGLLQTLGSVERLEDSPVTQRDVRRMVNAGYNSQWDIWQRVKTNHTYERQDGTFYANLSGKKNGVWAKFPSRESYQAYRDGREVQPIGRRRGIGDMLEFIDQDIAEVQEKSEAEQKEEVSVGDKVRFTEGGEEYEVTWRGRPMGNKVFVKVDNRDDLYPVDKLVMSKKQEQKEDMNTLTRSDIREIIADTDSMERAVNKIMSADSIFWKERGDTKQFAQKVDGENQWQIINANENNPTSTLSTSAMKEHITSGILESEEWTVPANENLRMKTENFVEDAAQVIDKIITALPEGESSEDEREFKQSLRSFRDRVFDKENIHVQAIKETRDTYVKLLHFFKNERPGVWTDADLVYRRDVKSVVSPIDPILENYT